MVVCTSKCNGPFYLVTINAHAIITGFIDIVTFKYYLYVFTFILSLYYIWKYSSVNSLFIDI